MRLSLLPHIGGMAFAIVLCPQTAIAQAQGAETYDVRDLYNTCATAPESPEYTTASYACLAFIGGAVQYHDAVSDRKHLKRLICYPQGSTVTDGRDAFVAWGKKNLDNEERMGEIAVIGLVRALAEKYPCK